MLYLHAVLLFASGVLIFFGLHRAVYSFFSMMHLPEVAASVLTGVLNLAWYEFAYAISRSLETVGVYTVLPYVGAGAGMLSALATVSRNRHGRIVVLGNLWFGVIIACLALILPALTGGVTSWRLITAVAFLVTTLGWLILMCKTFPKPNDSH